MSLLLTVNPNQSNAMWAGLTLFPPTSRRIHMSHQPERPDQSIVAPRRRRLRAARIQGERPPSALREAGEVSPMHFLLSLAQNFHLAESSRSTIQPCYKISPVIPWMSLA